MHKRTRESYYLDTDWDTSGLNVCKSRRLENNQYAHERLQLRTHIHTQFPRLRKLLKFEEYFASYTFPQGNYNFRKIV